MSWLVVLGAIAAVLAVIAAHDVIQKRHTILRNFPVIGHLRFLLEAVGPELRQYIVTDNNEERPFSRDQRRWVYASAKRENDYFGFGTDNNIEAAPAGYVIIKQSSFPLAPLAADADPDHPLPVAKVLGAAHGRRYAFRPPSVVNISGMSYGSLSGSAVEALNRGAKLAGCLQSTGEGALSPFHRCGGDLIFQIGTGYFGVRDRAGNFDFSRLVEVCAANPVRAIEIKLSQGAKPGLGGMLPGVKVTRAIAETRGIPIGRDCVSPSYHKVFSDVPSMLDFVERVADATGLPVGIKSAVGDETFWATLSAAMVATGTGPDFIIVDGGEGGTGAAPLAFTDHVSLPFRVGFPRVYRAFADAGLHHSICFGGSGKLGYPEQALLAIALGCDWVSVAREAMLAIGCVQAQRCHTGRCPTGVATQSRWLAHGLDPGLKSVRCANYVITLRKELLRLAHACGAAHPALVGLRQIDLLDGRGSAVSAPDLFRYEPGWGLPSDADRAELEALMVRRTDIGETAVAAPAARPAGRSRRQPAW